MQIIIPMTGYGSRFVAAGYRELKPFINVQGHPVIEWIIKGMYSDEDEFIFVCREAHLLENNEMEQYLKSLARNVTVVSIDNWVKKGPVFDVLRAGDHIDDTRPVIINYCDFYMAWDWNRFKHDVEKNNCDGAIPCYTGFHPHLIPKKNLYASCRTDYEGYLLEIREKYSFETDKLQAKHSPGVYYFKSGYIMKNYCQALVDSQEDINGEFYASMPYKFMLKDNMKIWVPVNVKWFCQWGTPEDMKEYLFWSEVCRGME